MVKLPFPAAVTVPRIPLPLPKAPPMPPPGGPMASPSWAWQTGAAVIAAQRTATTSRAVSFIHLPKAAQEGCFLLIPLDGSAETMDASTRVSVVARAVSEGPVHDLYQAIEIVNRLRTVR